MDPIRNCLTEQHAIVSVMGPHAGEPSHEIFDRKIRDVEKFGWTLWVVRSYKARPTSVQRVCAAGGCVYALFVQPSSPGGAQPTANDRAASAYSPDGAAWMELPRGLGPVTGKIDAGAYGLWFDQLGLCEGDVSLDLWSYGEFEPPHAPLRTRLGCSTVCATKRDTAGEAGRMKSRYRKLLAWGRLRSPGAVWLR
jgi:hypothetical protein